jgi:glutamate-ammonia-ligase adenylyltransferase
MFLIGTRIVSGTVSAEQAGEAFARLADALIRCLHRAIEERFAQLHGRIAGQQTAILALGKLGGREMAASSDLDLIVVYDFDSDRPESVGPRRLYGAQYFSRLTQRLISALTAQTNHGLLYKDLGAPGAHARARRVGAAAIRGPGRGGHSLRAMPSA